MIMIAQFPLKHCRAHLKEYLFLMGGGIKLCGGQNLTVWRNLLRAPNIYDRGLAQALRSRHFTCGAHTIRAAAFQKNIKTRI